MEREKVLITLLVVWNNLLSHEDSNNKTRAEVFILKILANLAVFTPIWQPFYSLGWLQLLTEGKFESLQLSSLRDKVLMNLLASSSRSQPYEDGIFCLSDSTFNG